VKIIHKSNYFRKIIEDPVDNVKTITTQHPTDDIKWLFEKVSNTNHYRSNNYTLMESIKDYALCYSITYVDSVPVLGSTAWNNPLYNGMIRVCSRYCINPDYIHNIFGRGTDGIRIDAIDHIDQQVEVTQNLGFEHQFMSREDKMMKTNRASARLTKDINKYSKYNWECSIKRKRVAPNPITGLQFIIYNNKEWLKDEDYSN